MQTILHVTECYAGGVSRAITSRVSATEHLEHHLLWSGDEDPNEPSSKIWASIFELPKGFLKRCLAVRKTVKLVKPDLIHAHSSWAGVYSRILSPSVKVVYEPHCFKFDDPGAGLTKIFYKLAEKILIRRTVAIGTLSLHETSLANSLDKNIPTVRLPNVPSIEVAQQKYVPRTTPRIVMVGRLAPQKDPHFFIDVYNSLLESGTQVEAVWIGDGDPALRNLLTSNNILVTGWLGAEDLVSELRSSIYVHTASYEGFPLSVLDAAALGIPVVARTIPVISETSLLQAVSAKEVSEIIVDLISNQETVKFAIARNAELLSEMNQEKLGEALLRLYALAELSAK